MEIKLLVVLMEEGYNLSLKYAINAFGRVSLRSVSRIFGMNNSNGLTHLLQELISKLGTVI